MTVRTVRHNFLVALTITSSLFVWSDPAIMPGTSFAETVDTQSNPWDNLTIQGITSQKYISDIEIVNDKVFFATYGGGIFWVDRDSGEVLGKLDSTSGLGHNLASALYYEPDSQRLWVGTYNGIARIDLLSMRLQFTVAPADYRQTDVTAITSAGGHTYFCCYEGLRLYSPPPQPLPVSAVNTQSAQQNPPRQVWSFMFRPQGLILNDLYSGQVIGNNLWFGGVGRVFSRSVTQESWRRYDLPKELCLAQVLDIIPQKDNQSILLLATSQSVYSLDTITGSLSPAFPDTTSIGKVRALAYGPGGLYVGAESGLYLIEGKDKKAHAKLQKAIPALNITSLSADGEQLWVGSDDGAYIYYPNKKKAQKIDNPFDLLPHPTVFSLAADADRLWVGTGDGLAYFNDTSGLTLCDCFPKETAILSLAVGENTVYCGTKRGLFAIPKTGEFPVSYPIPLTQSKPTLFEPEPEINAILLVGDTICAGTEEGLFIIHNGKIARLAEADNLGNNQVSALVQLGELIYAGTFGGGVAVIDPKSWKVVDCLNRAEDNLASDFIFSLEATSKSLFIGTWQGGMDVYQPGSGVVGNITWGDGLSHTDVWAIFAESPWAVLSVRSVGINVYDFDRNEVVCYLFARQGLGDGYVRDIAYFADSFWFAGSGGLSRVFLGAETSGWKPPQMESATDSTARNW